MSPFGMRKSLAVAGCLVAGILLSQSALAQSGGANGKPPEAKPDAAKDGQTQKKLDEVTEASRILAGPAGNPECIWIGRRVVSLLWRDDMDTAFRHLDLYDRFGCPSGQVQATFRCLVRQGNIDPKAQETLNMRIHACWINPALPPAPTTAQAPAGQPGTDKAEPR